MVPQPPMSMPMPQPPADPLASLGTPASADPRNAITEQHPSDIQAHIDTVKSRLGRAAQKKTLGYRQADIMRKDILTKFVADMQKEGIDVSTPEKLQEFLQILAQKDPDMAQILSWCMSQLMPDDHEGEHMAGQGIADIMTRMPQMEAQQGGMGMPPPMPEGPPPMPGEAPPMGAEQMPQEPPPMQMQ